MAIVMTLDKKDFADAFKRYNLQDQFSSEGLDVLFNYLEELSEDTGEPVELDVIALCCEYYESSIEELIKQYNIDTSYIEGDEDEIKEMVREYLEYKTLVCGEVCGGFVYAAF